MIAGYFGVSLDVLFDYDAENLAEKIQNVLFRSRDGHSFETCEKILLDGIAAYPGADMLKRELLERYAGQIRAYGRTDLVDKAIEIGKKLITESMDSFVVLGAKGDLADIYITSGNYEEGKKIIESMPYRWPWDIYDRMRCSVMFLKGEDQLKNAREWKRCAHQELTTICEAEGMSFWEMGDFENALLSFEESADVIERFGCRQIPKEYALLQSPVNQGIATIRIAACLYKLGRTKECDAALDKAYH